ncbi:oxidoreductase [Marivivens niveibacter]|uniref:Oxidoreductase n=1 Tax=Marivivens niveibacter TaxID=1930667 RepID=A0A251X0P3_9RHOB|nr:molybdopterin-dependent oxidoreductase [Marivivens niveibacter]OUD10156.1 oxidoreductase [Marivivens niveibacter]
MTTHTFGLRSFATAAAVIAIAIGTNATAQEMAAPQGVTLLTVSGDITNTNAGDTAIFDLEMLRALPATTIETSTIWTEGVQTFTGVELHAFLEYVGANGESIRATAINDYAIEIPTAEVFPGGALVAYENNGNTMSVRDKGPLWVVFPYDSSTDFQKEVIYSRSIWQLDRIEVLD